MSLKEYIFSLRNFILTAFLIFVFFILQGYLTAQNSPSEAEMVLETLRKAFAPIAGLPPLGQFLLIIFNNGIIIFLTVLFGVVFGIFPLLVLFFNGIVFGIVAFFSTTSFSWSTFLLGILPHGIVEIPVMILAGATGFKLGKASLFRILKKEGSLKTELNKALVFFIRFLFPFLVLAAFIEVFITARLL